MPKIMLTLTLALMSSLAGAQTGIQVFTGSIGSSVVLIQWTEATGQLKGSAQIVSVSPDVKSINLNVANSGLSGTKSGSDYSLVFEKPILGEGVSSAPAGLNRDTLLIDIPSKSGGLNSITLQRSTLQKFNASVIKLKADATARNAELVASIALTTAMTAVENVVLGLKNNVPELETVGGPQPAVLQRVRDLVRGLSTQGDQLSASDKGGHCGDVKIGIDNGANQQEELNTAMDDLATYISSAQSSYDLVSTGIGFYATALSQLKAVSAESAQQYSRADTPLLLRANKAVAKNGPLLSNASDLLDQATKAIDDFSTVATATACS